MAAGMNLLVQEEERRGSEMRLDGIHHVTAITGDARRNVAFYTGVLGLRLTAKSVNQDDPTVYHLFYGDEDAKPGADLTFFEYPHAIPGRVGPGMVHRIVWRVRSERALDFWEARLRIQAYRVERRPDALLFSDFEGLSHELVVDRSGDEPLMAAHPEIPREMALMGFEGVRAFSRHPEATRSLLKGLMGAEDRGGDAFELRGERRGGSIALDPSPDTPGRQSAGIVHHVAWFTTDAEQGAWLERLTDAGIPTSGIIDRHFFHSLYFREPGGVLFELATLEPGFTVDGPPETFGREIILPPWLEGRRKEIEARLTPLGDPRADWPSRWAENVGEPS